MRQTRMWPLFRCGRRWLGTAIHRLNLQVVNYDVGQDCEDDKDWVYPGRLRSATELPKTVPIPTMAVHQILNLMTMGMSHIECVDLDPSTWVGAQSVLDAYNLGQGGGGDCNDGLPTGSSRAAM